MNKCKERLIQNIAITIILNNLTIREAVKIFKVSRSTIHRWMSHPDYLKSINRNLYDKVQKVFKKHLAERHIKGGKSTSNKWKNYRKVL